MGGYFQGSPWTDAASYGQGLGQTLGQAMLAMPQQRYELAAQQAQMRAAQQREALQLALQQRSQEAQHQLGMSELNLHQQEMVHNNEYHMSDLEIQKQRAAAEATRAANEAKGTWKMGETKLGVPYRMNTLTGEHQWLPMPDGGVSGQARPQDQAAAQRQAEIEAAKMVGGFSSLVGQDGFQKSQPSLYSQGTNIIQTLAPYLIKSLTNNLGQANSQFQTGLPTNMAQPAQPNAPAIPQGLGMPATNPTAPGFKLYNPATGQIE